jgi:hypothetical protein
LKTLCLVAILASAKPRLLLLQRQWICHVITIASQTFAQLVLGQERRIAMMAVPLGNLCFTVITIRRALLSLNNLEAQWRWLL